MDYRVTVSAVIKNPQGKYLLCKQPSDVGVFPGQWAIPGGGIDPGETMSEALVREMHEEVGLTISNIKPLRFSDDIRRKHYPDGTKKKVYMIYLVFTCDTDDVTPTLNDEAEEYVWVTAEESKNYDLNTPTRETFEKVISASIS